MQAYEQRPGSTDSKRCLKLDSNRRPAKPLPWYFWVSCRWGFSPWWCQAFTFSSPAKSNVATLAIEGKAPLFFILSKTSSLSEESLWYVFYSTFLLSAALRIQQISQSQSGCLLQKLQPSISRSNTTTCWASPESRGEIVTSLFIDSCRGSAGPFCWTEGGSTPARGNCSRAELFSWIEH